jgi:serine/threonine-protein kinase
LAERIGGGAMGEVWRADDGVLERQVAIKILRPDLLDDDTFAARFRREAQVLATLSHPNIVNVHDYGESDSEGEAEGEGEGESGDRLAYIVMELIDGRSLDEIRRESGPMPAEQALGIIAQALDGLHAAHQREIVHRDIKPANLMLRGDGRVTVTDFGIARAAGAGTTLTDTHAVIGTALYMAPEHAEGHAIPASDLYSIGVVCYQLLTGEPPFTGGSPVEVLFKHVREPAPALPDTFPEPVRAFVAAALAKRPEHRHADAAAMADAARRAAAGLPAATPTPAPAPPPSQPPGKDTGRKRRRLPVILALPFVIVVSSVTVLYNYVGPSPGQPETEMPDAAGPSESASAQSESPQSSSSPSATASESDTDPAQSPSEADDGEEQAGSGSDGGEGQSAGQAGDGSAGGGGSGGGGSGDDPANPAPAPDPDPGGPPEGCGGDRWGAITNVGNGLSVGVSGDTLENGTEVIMGGNTVYGWVRSADSYDYFNACNLSSPSLATTFSGGDYYGGDVVLASGYGGYGATDEWQLESAGSGVYYIKDYVASNCLTSNGEGEQLTVTTCTPGNESQLWRIPR